MLDQYLTRMEETASELSRAIILQKKAEELGLTIFTTDELNKLKDAIQSKLDILRDDLFRSNFSPTITLKSESTSSSSSTLSKFLTKKRSRESLDDSKIIRNDDTQRKKTCHRCNNLKMEVRRCGNSACTHVFCGACVNKMVELNGDTFTEDSCPVCSKQCCCGNQTADNEHQCSRAYHCYRKCLISRTLLKKRGQKGYSLKETTSRSNSNNNFQTMNGTANHLERCEEGEVVHEGVRATVERDMNNSRHEIYYGIEL
eukprot:CAMPEP_0170124248 /NCGR_PEP_ID=MMETSP0020_2-20130122/18099_1 /TAXON_ID=98059 /ORGANISM="Dinobryon sp., Strain UTEXLB2267" /LENGTH=257 /DNA_ID=CAMNT_0010356215 /DNA_START=1 /DNA_END=774 /DNA_ORIENTATION=+